MSPRELLAAHRDAVDPVTRPRAGRCCACGRSVRVTIHGVAAVHLRTVWLDGRPVAAMCPGSAEPVDGAR